MINLFYHNLDELLYFNCYCIICEGSFIGTWAGGDKGEGTGYDDYCCWACCGCGC
jgi:hypothetical protein